MAKKLPKLNPDTYWVDEHRKIVWWLGSYPLVLMVEAQTQARFPGYSFKITNAKQLAHLKEHGSFYYD